MNARMKWLLLGLLLMALVVVTSPVVTAQGPVVRFHASIKYSPVCRGPASPGTARCFSQVISDDKGNPEVSASLPYGYGPVQFHTAYNLPTSTSVNQTIALVDAYDEPNMLSDLNTYSSVFGISGMASCPISSGTPSAPCFQKVDENGGTSYPGVDSGWAEEIALDVEVAHAICQNCNILLVEANSVSSTDLFTAIDTARLMGANDISNSWGGTEFPGETGLDSYLNHPGVVFTFSTGDGGYGTQFPAASPYVTAVGGTTLNINADNSYNSESVWQGAGSGCSAYEPKPGFQSDTGCANRTIGDVSADADPATGAAVYETATSPGGWLQVGGTSLSAPLIAGTYALAGGVGQNMGNSVPYANANSSNLHDVVSGNNGSCNPSYLCTGVPGYDGPTGLGTPKGTSAFSPASNPVISNPNPSDDSTVDRTTSITFYWSTSGASQCLVHIWGGPNYDSNLPWSSNCSSLFWGQQWPGAYQWQVFAKNSGGTTTGPVWHLYIKPYAPTSLSASPASQTQINLNWTKSSDDPGSVDSYKVYYSNGTYITTLGSGSTSYPVGGLSCGSAYAFDVTAVRQGVESNPSNQANASTQSCGGIADPRQEGPVSIIGSLQVGGRAYFSINLKNYGTAATPAIHPYIEGYANSSLFWRADGAQPGSAVIQPGQTVSFQDQYDLNVAGTWTASGIYLWNNDAGTYWEPLPANGQNQQFSFTVTNSSGFIYLPIIRRQGF